MNDKASDNVHHLNQDNVLGDLDDLSPSAFSENNGAAEGGVIGNGKKKTNLLPTIIFAVAALGIVVFFGYKMIAPHLQRGQESDELIQVPQAPTRPPSTLTPTSASPIVADTQSTPIKDKDTLPNQQAGAGIPVAIPQSSTTVANPDPQLAPTPNPVPTSIPLSAQQISVPAKDSAGEDIARVNARVDTLEKNVIALKESVDKLVASVATKHAVNEKYIQAKTKTSVIHHAVVAKKSTPEKGISTQNKNDKEKTDIAPVTVRNDLHLKAVLDGRAWLQNDGGDSITVTVGDVVRGMGPVKTIDAERGEVVFANGAVLR